MIESKSGSCTMCSEVDTPDMILCDVCDQLTHFGCAGITKRIKEKPWSCPKCSNSLQVPKQKKGATGAVAKKTSTDEKKTSSRGETGSVSSAGSKLEESLWKMQEEMEAKEKAMEDERILNKKRLEMERILKEKQLLLEKELREMELQQEREFQARELQQEQQILDQRLKEEEEFLKRRSKLRENFKAAKVGLAQNYAEAGEEEGAIGGDPEKEACYETSNQKVKKWLGEQKLDQDEGKMKPVVQPTVSGAKESKGTTGFNNEGMKGLPPPPLPLRSEDPIHSPNQHQQAPVGQNQHQLAPVGQNQHQQTPIGQNQHQQAPVGQNQDDQLVRLTHDEQMALADWRMGRLRNGPGQEPAGLFQAQIAARQSVSKQLPVFRGEAELWPIFISSYEYTTQACGFSNLDNLKRLQDSLKGDALEAVRSRLVLPDSVPDVIQDLRNLFGKPEKLMKTVLVKVRQAKPPRADRLETFIHFGITVKQLCDHLEAAGLMDHLNNPMLVQELVDKLPPNYKMDWVRFKRDKIGTPLRIFTEFMNGIVSDVSEVSEFSALDLNARNDRSGKVKPNKKEFVHVHNSSSGKAETVPVRGSVKKNVVFSAARLIQLKLKIYEEIYNIPYKYIKVIDSQN